MEGAQSECFEGRVAVHGVKREKVIPDRGIDIHKGLGDGSPGFLRDLEVV